MKPELKEYTKEEIDEIRSHVYNEQMFALNKYLAEKMVQERQQELSPDYKSKSKRGDELFKIASVLSI